jgi:hypothetical protein
MRDLSRQDVKPFLIKDKLLSDKPAGWVVFVSTHV